MSVASGTSSRGLNQRCPHTAQNQAGSNAQQVRVVCQKCGKVLFLIYPHQVDPLELHDAMRRVADKFDPCAIWENVTVEGTAPQQRPPPPMSTAPTASEPPSEPDMEPDMDAAKGHMTEEMLKAHELLAQTRSELNTAQEEISRLRTLQSEDQEVINLQFKTNEEMRKELDDLKKELIEVKSQAERNEEAMLLARTRSVRLERQLQQVQAAAGYVMVDQPDR